MILPSFGERNSKQSKKIVISGFDGDVGFNKGLPLSHERAQFIRGEVEPVEIGETVFTLDFVDSELDFSECVVLVLLQICE